MRIAIIGRTEILYDTACLLRDSGHDIACIITAKEAPEYKRTVNDFRTLAERWEIPFSIGGNISDHEELLQRVNADIGVSFNYTGIISKSIIDLFEYGILNAHGGDLPRYRGNAAQAWAILKGEERIGLCIHKMIGGELDSGDIIARDFLLIDNHTKVTHAWEWMTEIIPSLMLSAVDELSKNSSYILEKQSKNPKETLRCYPLAPEDGCIDWGKNAIDVLRLINASNKPYTGAFCGFEGEKMIIWDADLLEVDEIFYAVPGQITKVGDGFLEVACGEGKLKVSLVEYQGQVVAPSNLIKSIRKRLT